MNDNRDSSRAIAVARRWRIGLVISLALNLFLGGVVGVWALRPVFRMSPQPESTRIIDHMASRLQPADAAILRGVYDKQSDKLVALSQQLRAARAKMRRNLRAEPFDAAALEASMDEVRHTRMELMKALEGIVSEGAAAMSPNGRQALARGPQGRG